METILWLSVKSAAVKWGKENIPNAWWIGLLQG
jgi:hypothetical protein